MHHHSIQFRLEKNEMINELLSSQHDESLVCIFYNLVSFHFPFQNLELVQKRILHYLTTRVIQKVSGLAQKLILHNIFLITTT